MILFRRFLGEKEGAIIELETGKKLGTHRGYWFHTIGQRQRAWIEWWTLVRSQEGY